MLLLVGKLGRPHGVRGMLTVEVCTDEPEERFATGASLLAEPGERGPLTVSANKWHSGRLLLSFTGVTDREAAEALRGTRLLVNSDDIAPSTDPDTYPDHQLIGLSVERMDGEIIGEIIDVLHGPGGDTLLISHVGREVMVPFVQAIVPTVDIEAKRVVIDPPEGLLEL